MDLGTVFEARAKVHFSERDTQLTQFLKRPALSSPLRWQSVFLSMFIVGKLILICFPGSGGEIHCSRS